VKPKKQDNVSITDELVNTVVKRLVAGKRVRRTLPGGGRVHVDRALPFLCVYREPVDPPDAGTAQLIKGEAAFLTATTAKPTLPGLPRLVTRLAECMSERFGAFLIVENWSAPDTDVAAAARKDDIEPTELRPDFVVTARGPNAPQRTLESLRKNLGRISILKQAFFTFAKTRTNSKPEHHYSLGRRAMVKAVWDVDRRLAEIADRFDFLLQVTPVNAEAAWHEFHRGKFESPPRFYYRPLAVLSEYLVGGLSKPRLRLLAARVVASQLLVDGASFIDTFRQLDRDCDFPQRTAYTVTMRTYRGGGLTKDAVYLRGLVEILDYLKKGVQLDPLFVGKIAADHIPFIRELQHRKVLRPPPLTPRYLELPGVPERLGRVRNGATELDLIKGKR
jgi:hypothetical protein